MTRVSVGSRLHFGFGNLSLSHGRLYGALGVALDRPRVVVAADRDAEVHCDSEVVAPYVERIVERLDLPGASVRLERTLPRHAGLGSGTQIALATLAAVAHAYGVDADIRRLAPSLGRGGRSGIGVATFEDGGAVLDAGHPTARFTTDRPADGEWRVPAVAARHRIPDHWRFLLVLPSVGPGRNGEEEDASMRTAVERADPALADRIAGILVRRALPALAEGSAERFGEAVAEVGRLNGAWYADEQGGVYRPPVGTLVDILSESAAIYGAGQSSWGPAVYGITDATNADAALAAGEKALDAAGVDGDLVLAQGRNRGAAVEFERRNG
ncbi:beta-ribofuranosylaminobenzene 5'-phosphate synthase family protein [Haloferacaceae archaeon DSL9]